MHPVEAAVWLIPFNGPKVDKHMLVEKLLMTCGDDESAL